MAFNNILNNAETYIAGEDLSAEQYTFVQYGTGGEVVQSDAGENALGVLWNDPEEDRAATVIKGGNPHVYVGTGGVSAGDEIASDDEGRAVVAASSDIVVGYARHDAAVDGLVMIDFLGTGQFTKA